MRKRERGRASATTSASAAAASSSASAVHKPPKCVVPNVLHLKLAKAKARIRRRHCGVGRITRRHANLANRGRVIKQSPKASAKKRPNGYRVKLTVGR
jgi:beta-lactam-binding protein with PASTA domain